MEDIFQILIFVAFALFGIISQLAKGKKDPSAMPQPQPFSSEEEMEELFDDLKEEVGYKEPAVKQSVERARPFVSPVSQQKKKDIESSEIQDTVVKQKKNIRLSNKEEARRAFIYSEIFNRKY